MEKKHIIHNNTFSCRIRNDGAGLGHLNGVRTDSRREFADSRCRNTVSRSASKYTCLCSRKRSKAALAGVAKAERLRSSTRVPRPACREVAANTAPVSMLSLDPAAICARSTYRLGQQGGEILAVHQQGAHGHASFAFPPCHKRRSASVMASWLEVLSQYTPVESSSLLSAVGPLVSSSASPYADGPVVGSV